MVNEKEIDNELDKIVIEYPKLRKTLDILRNDKEIYNLLESANTNMVLRFGYTDHGKVHSKIVSRNALKIVDLLFDGGIETNLIKEKVANEEDTKIVILIASYLHDIGLSINRKMHELLSVIIARPIATRILKQIYKNDERIFRFLSVILECILCHMGSVEPSCIEAGIVALADGTDITEGRARIPFKLGKEDIHSFSTLAIQNVNIMKGRDRPIRIEVEMNNSAGIFQVEEILLFKIKHTKFDKFVELTAKIKEINKEVKYL
ncbi:MAG: HD domain-containing protein [Candidatus Parvarchaeota archaeon]|nr:HD domain-containing protein [Candidatus Jingweiarchaeum tengchongense]MCW1298241.1 HD domain-containing protein [Candidatus Jingweiarchaeum tengchongense]MCW1300039.1 HD domain-containing protein [Candidatus Jingweiarchaeum tengchongense]MCW1304822.1 HD domain-containing protein [Candidatus Jingweiarchaeum tengchongense]MCW1310480.1 HD domain-containing protein [Candidatus Jingweiarchaeum tengchongense]